jgi:anaerobic selenocysteine-containing dehydrogenase
MPEFEFINVNREMELDGYDGVVKSQCRICRGGCGVIVYTQGRKVAKIPGNPVCPIKHSMGGGL